MRGVTLERIFEFWGKKRETLLVVFHWVVTANLLLFLLLFGSMTDGTRGSFNDFLDQSIIGPLAFVTAIIFFILYFGIAFFRLINRFMYGKSDFFPGFHYLHIPVFLFFNGLLVAALITRGSTVLLPHVKYLYYEYRLPYLLVLAVFHSFLSVKLFQRSRQAQGFAMVRSLAGSAGTAVAVGLFLFNSADHISAGDNRPFPNNVIHRESPVDFVNPMTGTREPVVNQGFFPLVALPYGSAACAPINQDTERAGESYRYYNRKLTGFLFLRRNPRGIDFIPQGAVMAGTGKVKFLRDKRGLKYRHRDEISSPHYYRAILKPGGPRKISGEMTVAAHSGMMRFAFPEKEAPWLVIDCGSFHSGGVEFYIDADKGELQGTVDSPGIKVRGDSSESITTYFVIQSSIPPAGSGVFQHKEYFEDGVRAKCRNSGAVFRFAPTGGKYVLLYFGLSLKSIEEARQNIKREIAGSDFATIKTNARMAWEKALDVPLIPNGTEIDKGKYYTDMYRDILRESAGQ